MRSIRPIRPIVTALVLASILAAPIAASAAQREPARRDRADRPLVERPVRDDYVVGIEDKLEVFVWGEPQLSRTVSVRPDGKITLPLVNDVAVEGLTPAQIRDAITERLVQYKHDPQVTVMVEAINSYRVYFLGEINGQGAVTFFRPTRLLQAIAAANGLTEYANKKITLIREIDGVENRVNIDYKALLNGEPSAENILLEPGDTLLFH